MNQTPIGQTTNARRCPFCSSDQLDINSRYLRRYRWGEAWVSCRECDARGPIVTVNIGEGLSRAIVAWNQTTNSR